MKIRLREISSSDNPKVKVWRSLLNARGIKKHSLAIVSGKKIVSDILRDKPEIIDSYLVTHQDDFIVLPEHVTAYLLTKAIFNELDTLGTHAPLLIVSVPIQTHYSADSEHSALTLMLPFQDPVNIGSIVRTAVAFGISSVVLLEEAASPYHPKSIRASGGYVFDIEFFRGPSLYKLEPSNVHTLALGFGGTPCNSITYPDPCILLPGLEGPGLPSLPWISETVSIPMTAYVDSLNAAVATSIVLYTWSEQKKRQE